MIKHYHNHSFIHYLHIFIVKNIDKIKLFKTFIYKNKLFTIFII